MSEVKRRFARRCALLFLLLVVAHVASANIITVNTANNVSPGPGETSLAQALSMVQDGDSIHFMIPGPGPFYLVTPPLNGSNGYPAIVHHNVTIDGYTQPGAAPNTNPILASNNARIQIVLDSRAGGRHVEDIPGLSLGESEVLLVKGATNVTIRGLCFLGPGIGSGTTNDPATYAISFEAGAGYGHVNGCWFGVDLDRQSVYRLQDAVTGFEGPTGTTIDGTVIGVEKSAPNTAAARAQFNVMVGEYIPLILEGQGHRICGNFVNVFPDGLTDYNANGLDAYTLQAFIEIGRRGDNLVLGTDGDGHNDADERNIFGGATVADDGQLLEWYGGSQTNMVIAGNFIGVGVDGLTRFTNSMQVFSHFNSSARVRIGSDFDGVSDDLEGNLISMNYPFGTLYPDPADPHESAPYPFDQLDAGAQVSLRGNQLIGNNIPPYSFADGTGYYLQPFTNSCAPFMNTNQVIPTIGTNSSQVRLIGTCALPKPPYTNLTIDLYLADEEGWTNGQKFQWPELAYTDPVTLQTAYDGFAQGKTYLGSFVKGGPLDASSVPGSFNFDLSALNLSPGAFVTLSASYSADPPGTHNSRTHTSNFARPLALPAALVLAAARSGTNLVLSWPAAVGVATIQQSPTLHPPAWADVHPQPSVGQSGEHYHAAVPIGTGIQFYRLRR